LQEIRFQRCKRKGDGHIEEDEEFFFFKKNYRLHVLVIERRKVGWLLAIGHDEWI
jgi:hypothetical protein